MTEKIFNKDIFDKLFDEVLDTEQVSEAETKSYNIMHTIVDYVDC